jgi:hypothetical protein
MPGAAILGCLCCEGAHCHHAPCTSSSDGLIGFTIILAIIALAIVLGGVFTLTLILLDKCFGSSLDEDAGEEQSVAPVEPVNGALEQVVVAPSVGRCSADDDVV